MIDKEINLAIRAQLKGGRDIATISKSIEDLSAAIEKQAAAAKRGESSIDELKASLLALRNAQDALSGQASLVGQFQRLGDQIKTTQDRVDSSRASYDKYAEALREVDERSEAQQRRLTRLSAAYEAAQRRLETQQQTYKELGTQLREIGLDTENLADAENRLRKTTADLGAVYLRAQGAIETYADDVRKAREETATLAKQQRDAARDAELFAAAEQKAARAAEQRARDAQTFLVDRPAERAGAAAAAARADDEARQQVERQRQLAELRRDIEERSAVAIGQTSAALKQATRDAEVFAAAEQKAARAAEQRARDAQTFLVDRPAERQAAAAAAARADEEARQQIQRQRELAELRRDIEERSAQAAREQTRDTGLRKTADDAEAAARSYTTLARASTNLRPRVVSLREALTSITDPAAAARTSLVGIEKQVEDLSGALDPATNSIRDYQERIRELQAAQKAISGQASLIDDFRNQTAALREQRTELQAARAQVAQYAAAVRQGGDAAQQFAAPLAEAEARLRRAAVAMRQQVEATRQSREALRQAGVDTRNLADAQDRLTNAARRSTDAVRQLAEGARNVGTAAKQGGEGFSVFNDEGRTTLSLAQRIRGEILALAAAYVGLQGVLTLANDALRASTAQEGLRNTLGFALGGDGEQVTQQIEFLRGQAERLGVAFDEASKSYAKFAAAAIRSGAPVQEAQFIFESFAEVGRVINLTPDQINGLFNAIGQSFSKGKIQAEELRQQIGERLPGAFAFAQEALRDQFPDLNKALEQGQVGAENLLLIAESVRKAAATQLPSAIRSLDAEQQRFNNSVLFFKQEIAESGFGQAYIRLLKELTELLKSEDGRQFAEDISGVFSLVADVLRLLVQNFRELQAVAAIAIGLIGVKFFGAIVVGAKTASFFVGKLFLALTGIAGLLAGAVLIGWNIGAYFRDEFVAVEKAGIYFVRSMLLLFTNLFAGIRILFLDFPRFAGNAFKSMINLFNNVFARPLILVMRNIAEALNLDNAVKGLDRALEALTLRLNFEFGADAKEVADQLAKDVAQIKAVTDQQLLDAETRRQPRPSPPGTPTANPGVRRGNGSNAPSEGEIEAQRRKIEALNNALNALDAKINRADTQTLKSQLDAVDLETERIQKQIDEVFSFDRERAIKEQIRFDRLVAEQRAAVTKKFNDQIATDREALLKKVEAAEAAAGRKEKIDREARLGAIRSDFAAMYRGIEADRAKAVANSLPTADLDALLARTEAAERDRLAAETRKLDLEELQRREQAINDVLRAREQALRTISDLQAAGQLSRPDAEARAQQLISQTQPQIEALATSSRAFAESIRAALDPATFDEFIARLDLAVAGGARLVTQFDLVGQKINAGIGQGVEGALNSMADKLIEVANRTGDWGDVFEAAGKTILQTLAQVLRDIAITILREEMLIAIQRVRIALSVASGGFSGASTSAGSGVMHSGGVVGQGFNRTRNVSPMLFAGAPRYHTGGIVGLAPDEYPAILQKNEEVLSASDPRNIMNGGGMGRAAEQRPQRFVLVDDRARLAEALAGSEGEEVTMLHLRKNVPTLRQLLKG